MDPMFAAAGLTPAIGHNWVCEMPTHLGHVDGDEAWQKGPLTVMPKLATCGDPGFLDAVRVAFCERCRAEGLVGCDGELRLVQHYRLMDVRKL